MIALPQRRRSRAGPVWAVLALFAGLVLTCTVLAIVMGRRNERIRALEQEVESLRGERQALGESLSQLQDRSASQEQRLLVLEAADPAQQIAALQQALAGSTTPEQAAELRATLGAIQSRVDAFQVMLDDLAQRVEAVAPAGSDGGDQPPEAHIPVTPQQQGHNLSCESSAASMAATYHGIGLSEEEVLAALPRNANPHLGFRGNVDGPTGGVEDYGVYAEPIAAVLSQYGLAAIPVLGDLSGIRAAVARGNPVIAWVTYDLLVSTPQTEIIEGEAVTLVPNQHVVVVTGYNGEGFWANDPWDGIEHFYPASEFRRALSYFADMAIEVVAP